VVYATAVYFFAEKPTKRQQLASENVYIVTDKCGSLMAVISFGKAAPPVTRSNSESIATQRK
jgi:hypothetical protein